MASKSDTAEILAMLANAYPNYNLTPDTVRVYHRLLADIPAEQLRAAALECATNLKFFPSVYELRQAVVQLTARANNLPSAAEAWAEITRAPVHGFYYRVTEERDEDGRVIVEKIPVRFSHPLIEAVARNLGWPDKFWTDNPSADRARYMQAYEAAIKRAEDDMRMLPAIRAFVKRLESNKLLEEGER